MTKFTKLIINISSDNLKNTYQCYKSVICSKESLLTLPRDVGIRLIKKHGNVYPENILTLGVLAQSGVVGQIRHRYRPKRSGTPRGMTSRNAGNDDQ